VFLGDNIYPNGLPALGHGDYAIARARLEYQIDKAKSTGAWSVGVIFVPGNHDYHADRTRAVPRQAKLIEDYSVTNNEEMLPKGRCPGPLKRDFGNQLRLILIDSEWLLQRDKVHPCLNDDPTKGLDLRANFYDRLSQMVSTAGARVVVVAGHHPLTTHGPHGGFFPWYQHLFPFAHGNITQWNDILPIPVLSSVYISARSLGWADRLCFLKPWSQLPLICDRQDLSAGAYQDMIKEMKIALVTHTTPTYLILASGHEHSFQLLDLQLPGSSSGLQIISGVGTIDHHTSVGKGDNTLMATPHAGFVIVDVLKKEHPGRSGRVLIEVVEVMEQGSFDSKSQGPVSVRQDFRMWAPPR